MNHTRKSLLGAFALVATLSAPMAFAQQAAQTTDPAATGASAQPTASVDASASAAQPTASTDAAAAAQAATPAAAAQPTTSNDAAAAASVPKKSWADVDADKDGNLSKAEAAVVPSLGEAFDRADSNADGSLTAVEYKAYVKAKSGKKQ